MDGLLRDVEVSAFAGAACVVTGGLGFIGSNTARALTGAGARVTVIDAGVPQHGGDPRHLEGAAAPIEVVTADIADGEAVARAIAGADFVFNIAGQVSHLASMEDPLRDLDLNARANLAFLETVRRVNPGVVVVHTSTRQVYGRPRYLPVDEQHPTEPVDVNGISKLAAEQAHLIYARTYDMKASVLRLTNVFGPRQRLRGDDSGFLPSFIRRALLDEPITLYGDGSQSRDCLYVDDVIAALCAAALCPDAPGEVFNLGTPDDLTLAEIARRLVSRCGTGSVVTVPWPPERARIDIGNYRGDASKAKAVLGWVPEVTFDDGLAATIAYYRQHLAWYV
jgi:nucleoside-diphosphate-sugar epimerase